MTAEFFTAIKKGDAATVERSIAADAGLVSASENGASAVLTAIYYGRTDIAGMLVAHHPGIDVFEAAAIGDGARVAELLDRDRSLANAFAPDGFHPLGLAAFFRRRDVARLLLDRGADIAAPARNRLAVTALHSAVATDAGPVDHELVALLLERGAPVNVPHLGGGTPLHTAAFTGDIKSIRMLLARGADPALRTDDGKSAVEVARERGHDAAARMLETDSAPR